MSLIRSVFKCPEIYKASFKNSQALMTISVGQEVHEGEKFASTIELVNDSFKSCIILVDDSLQRHTMALNQTQDANYFFESAVKEGDLWLERNKIYYGKLRNLASILRWSDWLEHHNYALQQKKIKALIESDPLYKEAFEYTVNEFLVRYCQRLNNKAYFDLNRAYQLCWDYLVEECTALCLWPEIDCHFEVYPSRRNLAMDETHKRFILPTSPHLLRAVAIKFKNRKQYRPQRFELLKEAVL